MSCYVLVLFPRIKGFVVGEEFGEGGVLGYSHLHVIEELLLDLWENLPKDLIGESLSNCEQQI